MTEGKRDTIAELVTGLTELWKVAHQLKAREKATMSRAPRLLFELLETLRVLYRDVVESSTSFYKKVQKTLEDAV